MMRLPFCSLLLVLLLLTACKPVLPPEALASFAVDKLPLAQNVSGAFAAQAEESNFLLLYPELRNAPAPTWLRAGSRTTYRVAFATFAQLPDDPTPSGTGLIQYDVIAQNRRNVVTLATMINTQIQGQIAPLSHKVQLPGVGEIWFSPQVLENAEAAAGEGFDVARMPLEVEGDTYDVVHMTYTSFTNQGRGEEVWAFDVETGLLVFYRQALYGRDGSQQSGTTVGLVGQRRMRLPWRNGTVPDWVEPGYEFYFSGSQALDVGIPPIVPMAMATTTRITRVGALWSEHTQSVNVAGQPMGSSTGATGVLQLFGGLWLPSEAINALETGDRLDRDPLTGIETYVVEATNRQIVIGAEGAGYLSQLTYAARDGRLISVYLEQHTPTGTLYTYLEAAR